MEFYKSFDAESQSNSRRHGFLWDAVKSCSIEMLMHEQNESVKRAICGIISSIAFFEFQSGSWPEIVSVIQSVCPKCASSHAVFVERELERPSVFDSASVFAFQPRSATFRPPPIKLPPSLGTARQPSGSGRHHREGVQEHSHHPHHREEG